MALKSMKAHLLLVRVDLLAEKNKRIQHESCIGA